MKLQIERAYVEAMVAQFPELLMLAEQLKFGNKADIAFHHLSGTQLDFLRGLYEKAGFAMQGEAAQLSTLQHALMDGGTQFKEGDLELLVPVIAEFLVNDGLRGWLFKINAAGRPLAYLVSRIDFTPPSEEENGRILLELKANSMAKIVAVTMIIRERDIIGKTLADLFVTHGFLKETPELIATYDRSANRYFEHRADYSRQFSASGTGVVADDPTATHRNTDWSRKNVVVLSSGGGCARLVNDEEVVKDRELALDVTGDVLSKYLRRAGRSTKYNDKIESAAEMLQADMSKGLFTELPVHGYILMFHLEQHQHLWVRGTGIGCYFDDSVHEVLGLTDETFQSLYHFTVGAPLDDSRLQTLPAYAHLD